MRVGYLARPFDVINVCDLDLIEQARQRCDHLVVGVYSDEYVQQTCRRPPLVPLVERVALVSHIRGVDAAVVHAEAAARPVGDVIVFVVADEMGETGNDVVTLVPRRRSDSAVLPAAALPLDRKAVA